jgi:Ca-activated chloride channel family protein
LTVLILGVQMERILCLLGLLALVSGASSGQSAPLGSPSKAPVPVSISVKTRLVDLQVSVTDRKGGPVDNLGKENFRIFENGREQEIAVFGNQDLPVAVGIVVDHSGSMGSKLPEVAAAAEAFAQSSNPKDDLFVVNFNEMVSLTLSPATPFTSDERELRAALVGTKAHGETALYDAVDEALEHLTLSRLARQALIVVTDGGDNASKHNLKEVLDLAKMSRAQIYCIGIFDEQDPDANPGALRKLAAPTGGEAYFPTSPKQVAEITQRIAKNLRREYLLAFAPEQHAQGWRSVRVVASGGEKLSVHTRTGYLLSDHFPVSPGAAAPRETP